MPEVGHDPITKLNSSYGQGEYVLVEYLIPLKNTTIAQKEHVFFDIDVKWGEKVWFGCYSWRSKHNSAVL